MRGSRVDAESTMLSLLVCGRHAVRWQQPCICCTACGRLARVQFTSCPPRCPADQVAPILISFYSNFYSTALLVALVARPSGRMYCSCGSIKQTGDRVIWLQMEDTAGTPGQDIKMPAIPEEVSMPLS